ncbi:hypothetical protein SeMB42_g02104 [Synchytrium endobioticum]|uniref:tRNA (guanine(10)-N(2))-methyltransferase n=1 Tax=Synchytrium endobioticum TaxID=286115 RepID=A0A507D9V1_9FUNG|nr:hypothetical protein SeLEV6574_g02592 [Synchytrium endobioticum]TPX50877.1 hypothetical protein SeMB42_g02104 [Synchytrium endobioticum]
MKTYLVHWRQRHPSFRLPELEALAKLGNLKLQYDVPPNHEEVPYLCIQCECDDDARKLAKRSILIRDVLELWDHGETLEEVHRKLRPKAFLYEHHAKDTFKFRIHSFGKSLPLELQPEVVDQFAYLGWQGKIDLTHPQVQVMLLLHMDDHATSDALLAGTKHVYVGRLIQEGNASVVSEFHNKNRQYLGVTTMDAELSLICANIALARPGTVICDPFVGTGSFLFTCSKFGAYTFGCDIDGRQLRGKDGKSVESNIQQYRLQGTVLGNYICDMAHHPWRNVRFLDAIVCDPPYGIRAGAKKVGCDTIKSSPKCVLTKDGSVRYPSTLPYEIDDVLKDLLDFATQHLAEGGRLVYWLPVANESLDHMNGLPMEEILQRAIPQHPLLRLASVSRQAFGKWQRLLICQELVLDERRNGTVSEGYINGSNCISHNDFRRLYFSKAPNTVKVIPGQ